MARRYKTLFGLGGYIKGHDLVANILDGGPEAYNAERTKNPRWKPDFGNASLRGIEISQLNVKGADLTRADLNGLLVNNLEMDDARARTRLKRLGAIVD